MEPEHRAQVDVCAYSVRARPRPTVSTPVLWEEVEAAVTAGDPSRLIFEIDEVLDRVAKHGDLFVEVLGAEQQVGLPSR
jgi:bifunctional non-homologous end joining protein LigD